MSKKNIGITKTDVTKTDNSALVYKKEHTENKDAAAEFEN